MFADCFVVLFSVDFIIDYTLYYGCPTKLFAG